MAATALIGLAISAMLFAVAHGTTSRQDLRTLVVRHKAFSARIDAAIRSSRQVLQVGSNCIILWMGDTRANNQPNVSELRRIEIDTVNQVVRSYRADFTGMTQAQIDAADVAYDAAADFSAITASLKAGGHFPAQTWATGVTSWTIDLNDASAQQATLVSYRLAIQAGPLTDTIIGAAALRNP